MWTSALPLTAAVVMLGAHQAPAQERYVPVSPGESLRVTEAGGPGEAVVLIPGLFGSAFGFRELLPRLAAAGYRAMVVEPLGVGGSSKPSRADYSLTSQADRVAAVLGALDADPAVVVGHGVSSSIALRLACRHPERVRAVLSLEGGAAEAAATPGFRWAMRFTPLLKLFGGARRIRGIVRKALVTRSADPAWVTDEIVAGYTEAVSGDLEDTLTAYRQMARAREPQELRSHLQDVRCPVVLLLGAAPHEGQPSAAEIGLLQEGLAFFAVEKVPGVGHFIFEENPGAVVDAVERILAKAAQPGPVLARR